MYMLTIKFFASLRQIVGRSEATIDLPNPTTVAEVITVLEKDLPSLSSAITKTKSVIAINHEFCKVSDTVKDGDELAFIPPMSGGKESFVRIQAEDFSIEEEVERVKKVSTEIGGITTFLGTARDISKGMTIKELEFEHYPVMAEKKLNEIRTRSLKDFNVIDVIIVHRYGKIDIGENIVLIVAAARHRDDAFKACRWCIDELKQITPIWKKEMTDSGEIWVEEHP